MDYNDVRLFVRVVDAGSFAAAARELGTQTSAVSRGIARLEKAVGVRLLQRTTRKLALTDAGSQLFERVRGAVSGLEEAVDEARELGEEPRGVVRVTAPPDSFMLGLPEVIARFAQEHPAIVVELALTARKVDLVAEGFDLAIRAGKLADSSLVARKIGTNDVALYASPDYLARHGRPHKLSELRLHDCVLLGGHRGRMTWELAGPKGPESVVVQGRVVVDDMVFAARACAAGAGIALVAAAVSHVAVERGELERVLPDYRLSGLGVHIVLPTAKHLPARVALLRDFLSRELRRSLADAVRKCSGPDGRQRRR